MEYKELVIKMHSLCYGVTDPSKIELSTGGLPKNILGLTTFEIREHDNIAIIQLNSKLRPTNTMIVGVLWHEICHATPWINNGKTDGHSSAFYRRLWSKPVYAFYSICAEFWFGLLDAFN